MKRLRRIGVVVLVLVAVLALAVNYGMGTIVKTVVEKAGPAMVGAPITIEKTHFRLLRGLVQLKGFDLGNPEGFKTPHAIRVSEIDVKINVKSLFTDTIVIERIYVKAPEITYELGLGKSNIGRILDHLEGPEKGKEPSPKGGKKVIIEDFLIEDGRVNISTTLAMGTAAPVPLPDIHLTDIGKEEGRAGARPTEVVKKVFGEIVKSVGHLVGGSVDAIEGGVKKLFGKGDKESTTEAAAP